MSKPAFFITTPIYYPSANLHIGHAYCSTIADTIARYKRANGFDVRFVTGSDEHGLKIQRKAEENGMTPLQYVDGIVANFKKLWEMLGISYTDFVRSSSAEHERVVQEILQRVYDKGDIYKKKYVGKYCVPCESFWTDRQIEEAGGVCPDCGRPVETMEEEDYFFRMSKYADQILKHIENHPDFIQPVSRRNEMIAFLKQGLEDLCISRSTFDWGIPVPFDKKQITYVWFDALLCYFTGIGFLRNEEEFNRFWPVDLHLVGKEIVRFHTIIWPAMLLSMGYELPKKVYGHGWLVVNGDKMSKSKGNVVSPDDLVRDYGCDSLRMYELFVGPPELDAEWDDRGIDGVNRFLKRLWNMLMESKEKDIQPTKEMIKLRHRMVYDITTRLESFSLNTVISGFMEYNNKFIEVAKKEGGIDKETLETIAVLLSPFAPHFAEEMWEQLGHVDTVFKAGWPKYDENEMKDDEIKIPVQINGKTKAVIEIPADISKDDAIAAGREAIADKLTGNVIKEIYVPKKIINIVMK